MQILRRKTTEKIYERLLKALDDDTIPMDDLAKLLNAAAAVLEKMQSVEVLDTAQVADLLKVSISTVRIWAKDPKAPVVKVGDPRWPLHLLFEWLSVPQNFVDLNALKSA